MNDLNLLLIVALPNKKLIKMGQKKLKKHMMQLLSMISQIWNDYLIKFQLILFNNKFLFYLNKKYLID
jgi:hypothetical protein